jgi:hypothetical protein
LLEGAGLRLERSVKFSGERLAFWTLIYTAFLRLDHYHLFHGKREP